MKIPVDFFWIAKEDEGVFFVQFQKNTEECIIPLLFHLFLNFHSVSPTNKLIWKRPHEIAQKRGEKEFVDFFWIAKEGEGEYQALNRLLQIS